MKFTRKMYRSSRETPEFEEYTEEFEQPVKDRLVYLAFYVFWLAAWKVKPLSKAVDLAETIELKRHRRHCNNDCGRWTRISTGETGPGCTFVPFDARLDIKLFDLDRRNNTRIA